jgi:hypothetical protein
MTHVIRKTSTLVLVLGALACGGGGADAATEQDQTAVPAQSTGGDEEQASAGGTAESGDPCDFGGAERTTCQGGLVCCYPEQGEVEYGTCVATCPGYD